MTILGGGVALLSSFSSSLKARFYPLFSDVTSIPILLVVGCSSSWRTLGDDIRSFDYPSTVSATNY